MSNCARSSSVVITIHKIIHTWPAVDGNVTLLRSCRRPDAHMWCHVVPSIIKCLDEIIFSLFPVLVHKSVTVMCFLNLFFLVLEEGGVKMKLTVIDTPGFGDQINNENWWVCHHRLKYRTSSREQH